MSGKRPVRLTPPVDPRRDHVLGEPGAEVTLVEYGSYACRHCQAVHEVVANLRSRFGDRLLYVFRHRPIADGEASWRAAVLAEYASETTGRFWPVHEAFMSRGPSLNSADLEQIAGEFDLPPDDG